MRALVTSSRNTFALDIIRKLGSSGHYVVAADTYHGAIGSHSKYLAGHVLLASPRFETDQFIADVCEAVRAHDLDIIIPTFEEAFYLAARAADLPEGVTLFTGSFDKLARLHDKGSFQRLAEQAGVPIPETVVVSNEEELYEAIARFPRYFARAVFSRGGVGLLTNTGPLAEKMAVEDCHPTEEQPWLVQPFVDGPMLCTYSVIVDGKVTAHCTYSAPEQWAHSTGIAFRAEDSSLTLDYTQKLIDCLDPNYTGQLSFDFVKRAGGLDAIECNPRPTNGVILLETDEFVRALLGNVTEPIVVEPGVEREIKLAVLADAFTEPVQHLKTSLHDLISVRDIGKGWHDSLAMMWGPAALLHGAALSKGKREALLKAMGEDIVWNGEPIQGQSPEDAAALQRVHAQRI
ncbi:carbamoyl-phosphate synthase large subunit [Leucobacter sp. cx-42]|uniref:carbamoyl-phosphate synthase large subunit n=1 Tax=unclassified Leucobacter TaxID=2621730 RepID=UPI00165E503A|nr:MULTISPECIES: carbamoyl-phosphate synthase large subunit [unclassified Leucobacter]MBC9953812.1 carbamoyl-phosphate synthase large subunit [Leucobacter sp. cx-42]